MYKNQSHESTVFLIHSMTFYFINTLQVHIQAH